VVVNVFCATIQCSSTYLLQSLLVLPNNHMLQPIFFKSDQAFFS
jgi:hypothetical protein